VEADIRSDQRQFDLLCQGSVAGTVSADVVRQNQLQGRTEQAGVNYFTPSP
jgi:hypothetical protein